jgi:hypothetical protein
MLVQDRKMRVASKGSPMDGSLISGELKIQEDGFDKKLEMNYSVLRFLTGFAFAALIACDATVARDRNRTTTPTTI